MEFDQYGLIQPDRRHKISSEKFKEAFVDSFSNSETRSQIYSNYLNFTDSFSKEVTSSFAQWIGGSFTTQKENPNDIDVLTILSKSDYERNKILMESKFNKRAKLFPFVDSYFLQAPATLDSNDPLFKSDLVYWVHQFSYTRKNRKGRRQSRGYIEIIFNSFSYE